VSVGSVVGLHGRLPRLLFPSRNRPMSTKGRLISARVAEDDFSAGYGVCRPFQRCRLRKKQTHTHTHIPTPSGRHELIYAASARSVRHGPRAAGPSLYGAGRRGKRCVFRASLPTPPPSPPPPRWVPWIGVGALGAGAGSRTPTSLTDSVPCARHATGIASRGFAPLAARWQSPQGSVAQVVLPHPPSSAEFAAAPGGVA